MSLNESKVTESLDRVNTHADTHYSNLTDPELEKLDGAVVEMSDEEAESLPGLRVTGDVPPITLNVRGK